MSEQNVTPRGFSVGDLASPEVVGERVRAWAQPMSAEEATANLHANAAAIGGAFPAPIPGLNWAFKAAADAEAERVRLSQEGS